MNLEGMKQLGKLMGVSEERMEEMVKNISDEVEKERKFDFNNISDISERHSKIFEAFKEAILDFKDADEVECDYQLINHDMMQRMWHNMSVYSYDIDNFFLDKFVFHLKDNKELIYKMYFSIEDKDKIFLYVESHEGFGVSCGAIGIKDGKFLPTGAVNEDFLDIFTKDHIKENLPTDREFIANRALMNSLLYIIIVNQMVKQNREIVTETSRRVEVQGKKKPSKKKKNQPRKTKQITYIKIDGEKVRRIREDYERAERESFERHTPEWSRRGHYKKVRSGEIKWIAPTTCHAKDKVGEKVQKIYKIK